MSLWGRCQVRKGPGVGHSYCHGRVVGRLTAIAAFLVNPSRPVEGGVEKGEAVMNMDRPVDAGADLYETAVGDVNGKGKGKQKAVDKGTAPENQEVGNSPVDGVLYLPLLFQSDASFKVNRHRYLDMTRLWLRKEHRQTIKVESQICLLGSRTVPLPAHKAHNLLCNRGPLRVKANQLGFGIRHHHHSSS